jgi:hypothetical protein
MVRPGLVALALLATTSCRTSGRSAGAAPPPPVRVQSVAPPRNVIRAAAQQLTVAGFLVTSIDSSARLRAERAHRPGELDGTLTCRSAASPAARASIAPTLIIDLSAAPRDDGGSDLLMASRVHAFYLRLTAEAGRPANDTDCRSTGVVERELTQALVNAIR